MCWMWAVMAMHIGKGTAACVRRLRANNSWQVRGAVVSASCLRLPPPAEQGWVLVQEGLNNFLVHLLSKAQGTFEKALF